MDMQLPVGSLMVADPVCVRVGEPLSRVRELLAEHAFNHLPVVSDQGGLVGILSAADLAQVSLDAWVADADTVSAELDATFELAAVMTHEPVTASPDTTLRQAAELLGDGGFHSLPVVSSDGTLVGMLTSTDLLRHLARQHR
jgi:CBS domain-containing protein